VAAACAPLVAGQLQNQQTLQVSSLLARGLLVVGEEAVRGPQLLFDGEDASIFDLLDDLLQLLVGLVVLNVEAHEVAVLLVHVLQLLSELGCCHGLIGQRLALDFGKESLDELLDVDTEDHLVGPLEHVGAPQRHLVEALGFLEVVDDVMVVKRVEENNVVPVVVLEQPSEVGAVPYTHEEGLHSLQLGIRDVDDDLWREGRLERDASIRRAHLL